ncbi:MAG: hypothetical protein CL480_11040 [Acidobacteria bacterium]|mgnify:CR=1 FL=1|nr:hypothetical protein [Acidobacteriota bacterium]|tara:strand:- start:7896 stop:8513 length:618 start_codon:yes stop_codon:yes gene_type:complete
MSETVFFDLETGGIDKNLHPIIQIAAAAVDFRSDYMTPLRTFETKIQFDVSHTTPEALEKNSYDPAVWEDQAVTADAARDAFSSFLREYSSVRMVSKRGKKYKVAQLIGHNASSFDFPFLQKWYENRGFLPASFSVWDTCQRARWAFAERPELIKPESNSLSDLAEYFNITFDAHDAMEDVLATIKVVSALRRMESVRPLDFPTD